jgi:uncharacterized protein YxjI
VNGSFLGLFLFNIHFYKKVIFSFQNLKSMHSLLNNNLFLVKEHVGVFKAANNFDVFDPKTNSLTMQCREEDLGFLTKMLRFSDYKRMTPFHVTVRDTSGNVVLEVKRGISLFLSNVEVFDDKGQLVGRFKQKFFSIGGAFKVLDANDQELCELKGKWTGWDFKFIKDGTEYAHVSKKWAGLGKELFTSADNYVLAISDQVQANNTVRLLILGAVMCIDLVLKE